MDPKKEKQDEIVNNAARAADTKRNEKAVRPAETARTINNIQADGLAQAPRSSQAASPMGYNKNEASLVSFRKVVRGFSPEEVYDYISVLNANLENARRVFDAQSSELKNNLAFVSRERDNLKEEQKYIAEKMESFEQIHSEYEAAAEEVESLKAQNVQLQEQVKSLYTKLGSCKNLVTENQQYKKIIGEFDRERNQAKNEMAKLNAEIAELREINTRQAYAYAEQKKEIEMQFTNERLRNAELIQVHTYHIQKTEELMNEMYKQFAMAKKSLEEIDLK